MTGGQGESLYRRKDRLVNDYNMLRARVEYCRAGAGADWSRLQTGQVVGYLDRHFYRFTQPGAAATEQDGRAANSAFSFQRPAPGSSRQ